VLNAQGTFGPPTITIDDVRWEGDWSNPAELPLAVAEAARG